MCIRSIPCHISFPLYFVSLKENKILDGKRFISFSVMNSISLKWIFFLRLYGRVAELISIDINLYFPYDIFQACFLLKVLWSLTENVFKSSSFIVFKRFSPSIWLAVYMWLLDTGVYVVGILWTLELTLDLWASGSSFLFKFDIILICLFIF